MLNFQEKSSPGTASPPDDLIEAEWNISFAKNSESIDMSSSKDEMEASMSVTNGDRGSISRGFVWRVSGPMEYQEITWTILPSNGRLVPDRR